MTAKKCPSCGKERCPGIVMYLNCPQVRTMIDSGELHVGDPEPLHADFSSSKVVTAPRREAVTKTVTTLIKESEVVTHHRGKGWRLLGDKPMTPAERQRRHREGQF